MENGMQAKPSQPLQTLGGMNIAILVADGFEESEMTAPRHALEEAGALTRIVSLHTGKIHSRRGSDAGADFDAGLALDAADPLEFDALVLPGGAANGERMRDVEQAQAFARAMHDQGKPIAAICHGSSLLISAGLAKDHALTGAPDIKQDALAAGARWADQPVVVDDNIVSSRGPQDLPQFSQATIEILRRRVTASVAGTEDEARGTGSSS
jgi:protease I